MAQKSGKVKWFDVRKGIGFITDEEGNDIFAHFSGIAEGRHYVGLKDGDEVTFEVVQGRKGDQAASIRLVLPQHKNEE